MSCSWPSELTLVCVCVCRVVGQCFRRCALCKARRLEVKAEKLRYRKSGHSPVATAAIVTFNNEESYLR